MQELQRPDRLYVVTRRDTPIGLAAAQCGHACFLFARDRWPETAPWMRDSQWLVMVTVADEIELRDLCLRASMRRLGFTPWYEPDRAGEMTAVAFAPGDTARRICGALPLLGKEPAMT